jgi:hypothetical protein
MPLSFLSRVRLSNRLVEVTSRSQGWVTFENQSSQEQNPPKVFCPHMGEMAKLSPK